MTKKPKEKLLIGQMHPVIAEAAYSNQAVMLITQLFRYSQTDGTLVLWQEMMQVISGEPDVMAIVSHRRNEKGYRHLQGDRMRSHLLSLISTQVRGHSVMHLVSHLWVRFIAVLMIILLMDSDVIGYFRLLQWVVE